VLCWKSSCRCRCRPHRARVVAMFRSLVPWAALPCAAAQVRHRGRAAGMHMRFCNHARHRAAVHPRTHAHIPGRSRPSLWLLFPCAGPHREAVPSPRLEATSPGRAFQPRGTSVRLPSSTRTRSHEHTHRPSPVVATPAASLSCFASATVSRRPPTRARMFPSYLVLHNPTHTRTRAHPRAHE
jgi:hypothetical protein